MDEKSTGMNLSQKHLYESFEANYNAGNRAVAQQNYALAKEKFITAAEYASKLAVVSDGETKAGYTERARRLREIANAMDNHVKKQQSAASNGSSQGASNSATNRPQPNTTTYTATEYDDNAMAQYVTFYATDQLEFGFEGVVGLEDAKETVNNYVVLPMRHPEVYNYKFLDNKAMLLEGPPGTGKTTFAKAVAKEIDQPFAIVNVAALVNAYIGDTAKNIDKIFDYLRQYAEKNNCGVTVFFDELDEIAKSRGMDDKVSEAAVPALLRNLDGLKSNKNLLIIANTNRKDVLDKAILERFRRKIYIPLPDKNLRILLFKGKLNDVEPEFAEKLDFDAIGDASEGLSGRSIGQICDDFKHVLGQVKLGLVENDVMVHMMRLIDRQLAESKIKKP